jgi:hypothetical protein
MENNLSNYLNFLDSEIEKANKFGRQCQREDFDFKSAQIWYCIAEAFKVAKEKATELLK